MKDLLLENIFIARRINEKAKQGIAPAASGVAKGLQRHPPFEWRVKEVDGVGYHIRNHVFLFCPAKVLIRVHFPIPPCIALTIY
jgi:hypothetical protein